MIDLHLKGYYGRIGSDFVDKLLSLRLITIREIKGKQKTVKVIDLEFTDFTIFFTLTFPRIFN